MHVAIYILNLSLYVYNCVHILAIAFWPLIY